jgi:hypothetical protein
MATDIEDRHEILTGADEDAALEELFARGWTDGLPVVVPTPARVERMLAFAGVPAADHLAEVPKRALTVTAGDAAVNAVMAGCEPRHLPVVLAAVRAVCDDRFNIHSASASTSGSALCLVVSGPLAAAAGLSGRRDLLGGGNRANMTIGRAVRLVVRNILGSREGRMDASCIGNPARLSLCFAEDPPPSPWPTLRAELGHADADTIVVAFPSESSRQIANLHRGDADSVLRTFAAALRTPFTFPVAKHMQGLLVIGPDHAGHLVAAGVTKEEIRRRLQRATELTVEEIEAAGVEIEWETQHAVPLTDRGTLATFATPSDLMVVTAGQAGLGFSAYIPGIAPKLHFEATTSLVDPAPYAQDGPADA